MQLLYSRSAICELLCHLDRLTTIGSKQLPETSAIPSHKQPQLAVADLIAQERQHRLRISARQPLGFGHRLFSCSRLSLCSISWSSIRYAASAWQGRSTK